MYAAGPGNPAHLSHWSTQTGGGHREQGQTHPGLPQQGQIAVKHYMLFFLDDFFPDIKSLLFKRSINQ